MRGAKNASATGSTRRCMVPLVAVLVLFLGACRADLCPGHVVAAETADWTAMRMDDEWPDALACTCLSQTEIDCVNTNWDCSRSDWGPSEVSEMAEFADGPVVFDESADLVSVCAAAFE